MAHALRNQAGGGTQRVGRGWIVGVGYVVFPRFSFGLIPQGVHLWYTHFS